jgi:lysophospholipase L1-like esterase
MRVNLVIAGVSGAAALVCLLGVAEFATRYRERHRSTVPGTMPLLFYRPSRLSYALVRGTDYFGWMRVDSAGFRGAEVPLTRPAETLRIMVVGSSTTFDSQVTSDERAWPARLQHWLENLVPGLPVEVINAGVPGNTMLDALIRLQTELYRFEPDLLILYEGHNDLFNSLVSADGAGRAWTPRPGEISPVTPWARFLERHSLLYGKLMLRRIALRGRRRAGQVQRAELKNDATPAADVQSAVRAADAYERELRSFIAVAGELRIPVVLPELVQVSGVGVLSERDAAVRAGWIRSAPRVAVETVLATYDAFNARLRAAAQARGATVIGTREFGLAGPQWYATGDPIHFNDAGADRMGRKMAEALLTAGLVRRSDSQPRR